MENIKSYYQITDKSDSVKIKWNILPKDSNVRAGRQTPEYIIIHEVSPIYDNQRENRYWSVGENFFQTTPENDIEKYQRQISKNGENPDNGIGWHYTVGDNQIIKHLEDTTSTFHTGTKLFNYQSIGVERLVNIGTNFSDALHNQAKLIATLMKKWQIPITNVITHKDTQIIAKDKLQRLIVYMKNICDKIIENKFISDNDINNLLYYIYLFKKYEKISMKGYSTQINLKLLQLKKEKNKLSFEKVYEKVNSIMESIKILEKIVNSIMPKECPGRLLEGVSSDLATFYSEIQLCYQNEDFFKEIFIDKEIETFFIEKPYESANYKYR